MNIQLPVNIQGWFPLGLTGLISLLSKEDSQESSPMPQFESISSPALSLLYGPTLISVHGYWENRSFDYMNSTFVSKVMSLLFNMLKFLTSGHCRIPCGFPLLIPLGSSLSISPKYIPFVPVRLDWCICELHLLIPQFSILSLFPPILFILPPSRE